jgi:hypothetical protein
MNNILNINKNEFGSLTEDQQLTKLTTPVYVPLTENPDDETFAEKLERYRKFEKLPEAVRYKLVDPKTSRKIKAIGRKYNFDALHLANITRIIREYYFGEAHLENFPREIEKRMGISPLVSQEITDYIQLEIIKWDAWGEYLAKLPKVTARELDARYPRTAEREITNDYIEFKDRPDQIFDPSIKNWLRDYISHMGQTNRSDIERTNYLFHTKNTEKLTSQERERLSILLKSFDENIPLAIDTETQEVVFENLAESRIRAALGTRLTRNAVPERKIEESSFIKTYKSTGATAKTTFVRPAASTRYPIPSKPEGSYQSSAFLPRETSFRDSVKPSLKAPLPKIDHSFRPEVAKFKQPAQSLEKRFASSAPKANRPPSIARNLSQSGPQSDNLQFFNPYPTPGKHEVNLGQIAVPQSELQKKDQISGQTVSKSPIAKKQNDNMALQSTIKVKGFTEKQTAQPKRKAPSASSKKPVYDVPNRQKNVLYPHDYFAEREEKPEVKIDGNTVDLSGKS